MRDTVVAVSFILLMFILILAVQTVHHDMNHLVPYCFMPLDEALGQYALHELDPFQGYRMALFILTK